MKAQRKSTVKKASPQKARESQARAKILKKLSLEQKISQSAMPISLTIGGQKFKVLDTLIEDVIQGFSKRRLGTQAPDDLLSTQQIADILKVSRPHVAKLMDEGKLRGRKIGPRRQATRTDVEEFKNRMFSSMSAVRSEIEQFRKEGTLAAKVGSGDYIYEPSEHKGFITRIEKATSKRETGRVQNKKFVAEDPSGNKDE